ncbi:hypothetical protein [Streptomyces decoyicus]|uniref:hypothetical protein n=1 Tax=Streptomyces decoyicus TaxID=249567 RepID=UPI0033AC225F
MTITPRLLAKYRIPGYRVDGWGVDWRFQVRGPALRLTVDDAESLRLYELREKPEFLASYPRVAPKGIFAPPATVAPDLSFAVFHEESAYCCVARGGDQMWELPYGRYGGSYGHAYVSLATDGPDHEPRIWLRLPSDDVARSLFVTLDVRGREVARNLLPCGGSMQYVRLLWGPDGDLTGVRVSGGGLGTEQYAASLDSGRIVLGDLMALSEAPPAGLDVLGTSPSGTGEMTVDQSRGWVRWHRLPFYEEVAALNMDDFPAPGTGDCAVHDRPGLSVMGGYVNEDTALVTLSNMYDEARVFMFGRDVWQEFSHWLADTATGGLHGRLVYPTSAHPFGEVFEARMLGDGTWLTSERDTVFRWGLP